MEKNIPTEIWIIIGIMFLYEIIGTFSLRYYLLHPEIYPDTNLMTYQTAIYFSIVVLIIQIILIIGLYKGFQWARYSTIVLFSMLLILYIYSFIISYVNIFYIVIAIAVIFILSKSNVRNYFIKLD